MNTERDIIPTNNSTVKVWLVCIGAGLAVALLLAGIMIAAQHLFSNL